MDRQYSPLTSIKNEMAGKESPRHSRGRWAQFTSRTRLVIIAGGVVVAVAVILGLGLGIGLKDREGDADSSDTADTCRSLHSIITHLTASAAALISNSTFSTTFASCPSSILSHCPADSPSLVQYQYRQLITRQFQQRPRI